MSNQEQADCDTIRLRGLSEAVLKLWAAGGKSTFCIAQALGADERDVCAIIDNAQERRPEGRRE